MANININDLAVQEQTLSKDEMDAITGGYRFRQVRYGYRTVRRVSTTTHPRSIRSIRPRSTRSLDGMAPRLILLQAQLRAWNFGGSMPFFFASVPLDSI